VVPLNTTAEPLLKPVPVSVRVKSLLPAASVPGERLISVGTGFGSITVKAATLVAVPPGVVTAIGPLVAPIGTVKVRVVALATV
jgi:hypothetical protein